MSSSALECGPDESGSSLFWFLNRNIADETGDRSPHSTVAFDATRLYVIASLALRLRLLK
jgi:hypothetical protein